MPQISGGFARWSPREAAVAFAALFLLVGGHAAAAQVGGSRAAGDLAADEAQRAEGAAILGLADAAMAGQPVPADFTLRWHPDFLKAQQGTFVPFVLTVSGSNLPKTSALLYIRAVARGAKADQRTSRRKKADEAPEPAYPVDILFPVDVQLDGDQAARIRRGFVVPPGDYDVCVVLRERPASGADPPTPVRAGVLTASLAVPNFWTGELTVSSVMLADRLTVLTEAPTADELLERPYVIGLNDVEPAVDARFANDEELICVFLVYNAKVTADQTFDVEVEYHFYRRNGKPDGDPADPAGEHPAPRPGETYVNHTRPQRFNPASMGAGFNPAAGQPIMAGQGVPLAGFQEGDYRLMIKVTDLLAGRTLTRDVNFTVGS